MPKDSMKVLKCHAVRTGWSVSGEEACCVTTKLMLIRTPYLRYRISLLATFETERHIWSNEYDLNVTDSTEEAYQIYDNYLHDFHLNVISDENDNFDIKL